MRLLLGLPPQRRYLAGAALLLAIYGAVAVTLAATRDFVDRGPLSLHEPSRSEPLPDAVSPARALDAVVVDADGFKVSDIRLLKRSGAWPWIGTVKSGEDLVVGVVGIAAVLGLFTLYYRRDRPGPPVGGSRWWRSQPMLWLLLVGVPVVGWLAVLLMPGISRARKRRLTFQLAIVWSAVILLAVFAGVAEHPDSWGLAVLGLEVAAFVYGLAAGRRWLRPAGFGTPE